MGWNTLVPSGLASSKACTKLGTAAVDQKNINFYRTSLMALASPLMTGLKDFLQDVDKELLCEFLLRLVDNSSRGLLTL